MPSVEEEKQIVFKELKVVPRGCSRACLEEDVERLEGTFLPGEEGKRSWSPS